MRNMDHLAPERLDALKEGLLSGEEAITALEHIGECARCAEAFADCFHDHELLEFSTDFKPAVLTAAGLRQREIEKRRDEKTQKQKADGRHELFRYSFRVSIAASITLFLLFSGSVSYGINFSQSINTDLPKVNVITENLKGFSDKLIDFEVIKYLREE